jgi:hypothetical protein
MATAPARRAKASDEDSGHSGRLLLRMPPELHGELARAAERDGSSLNAYITRVLSDAVGRGVPRPPAGGSRLLRYAIIADLVLVAVAAIAAVALLIAAG